jgi:tRNA(Ile)-lysidine synthase
MQDLLLRYRAFVEKEKLFSRDHSLLLALSGGLDSCILLHLCVALGYRVELAHCNFGLRGAESDRDESFVKELASSYGLVLHMKRFETEAYAESHKLSIQEAARYLRYAWFRQLLRERSLHRIVTAHHADDNVETSLMNLFKGTGISGLRGMLPLSGDLARPLLFATRTELQSYAETHGISHVEDSSNLSADYTRNYFRLHVIPLIEQAYPSALANLRGNLQRFRETEMLYREAVAQRIRKLVREQGDERHVPVEALRQMQPRQTLLFELFHPYGFTTGQLAEIEKLMDSESGRSVSSATHRLIRNRNWFILTRHDSLDHSMVMIPEGRQEVEFPGGRLRLSQYDPKEGIIRDASTALVDASQLNYPLMLRRWRPGDYFYPLGMRKKKKLARFFIDEKLSQTGKEKIWVIESGERIIWVVGMRIDDRFRILPSTREALRISLV